MTTANAPQHAAQASPGHWDRVLDSYLVAVTDLRIAIQQASLTGQDLDIKARMVHKITGLALLYAPAQDISQVAVKIRVADNLFNLDQLHPGLSSILLDSLLARMPADSTEILMRLMDLH